MSPTVGSLFSGIGGLDLGLERAGWEVRWQSEVDPYASRVLAKHWPHVPNLGDVTTTDWSTVEHVDLICGGFPCQPVSQAGLKHAQDDPRWLWPAMAAAIRHLRPRFVLVENVADLVVRGLGDVLADLASLRYDAEWEVLPAAAFGAPHRRERLYLLADADGLGRQEGGRVLGLDAGEGVPYAPAWRSVPRRGTDGRVRPFPDPGVQRVADGPASGVDVARLRVAGNAVVPQVAEWLGRRILATTEP